MTFFFRFLMIIFINVAVGQSHAMWALAKFVKENTTFSQENTQENNRPFYLPPPVNNVKNSMKLHAVKLLEQNSLDKFLEYCELWDINPNHIKTNHDQTALMLACIYDETGEIVKQLLTYDDIDMQTWDNNGVWKPLAEAIDAENWHAIEAIIACKKITLSAMDIHMLRTTSGQD